MPMNEKFGFGKVSLVSSVSVPARDLIMSKTLLFGGLCQVVAYAIQCSAPPFPVFVMAYTINGVGIALQVASSAWHRKQALMYYILRTHRQMGSLPF